MSTKKRKAPEDLLEPAEYVAKVRLSGPENETLAEAGKTCERVPAESLPWLVKQKLVEPKSRTRTAEEGEANGEAGQ